MLANAARRLGQTLSRSIVPMEALAVGAMQQQATVTSGPAGAVYNVGKVSF